MITIVQLIEQTQGIHPVFAAILFLALVCWFVIKMLEKSASKYRRNDDVSKSDKK